MLNDQSRKFSIVSNDANGDKFYTNCLAYGEKCDILKDFKKGVIVKVSTQVRSSMDNDGKVYSNVKALSSKILKAKEQMKNNEEKKDKICRYGIKGAPFFNCTK